jgi:hypothetical protein
VGAQPDDTLQRMPSGHTIVAHESPVHLRGVSEFFAKGPHPGAPASVSARTTAARTPRERESNMDAR